MGVIKRHNKWWVDFCFKRERYRRASPDNSRAGALAYEAVMKQRLARGEPVDGKEEPKENKMTFREFVPEWLKNYVEVNNKPSEARSKRSVLRAHLLPFFGNMKIRKINNYEIERFKGESQRKGISNKTVNNTLCVLGKALRTAEEWKIIDYVPKMRRLKITPPKFDYLSQEECEKLLSHADGFMKDLILLAWHTGLRFGELIALTWKDVDLKEKGITVRQAVSRGILGTPKNNKSRQAFMTSEVHAMLLRRKEAVKSELIFPNTFGNFLIQERCRNWLHDLCEKAGIRRIGWHVFRHTFASHLAEKGISLRTVQELLGHSDPQTTMRYAHLGPMILKEAVKIFEKPEIIALRHNSVTGWDFEEKKDEFSPTSKANFSSNNKTKTPQNAGFS